MDEVTIVTRESEREKYQACYARETYHCQGARLQRVTKDAQSIPVGASYVDVGCGRAEMVKLAASRGVAACGVELVPELCGRFTAGSNGSPKPYYVIEGVVTALPFQDRHFEFVSCYDMLEHLPEDQVDTALDELFRVCASTLFLTTNDKESRLPLSDGSFLELHLTRKPRAWWNEKIGMRAADREAHEVIESEYGRGEWHWEIRL